MAKEITTNEDLRIGKYYHCFSKKNSRHEVHSVGQSCGVKYLGNNKIWADRSNNQALDMWRIFEVEIPTF